MVDLMRGAKVRDGGFRMGGESALFSVCMARGEQKGHCALGSNGVLWHWFRWSSPCYRASDVRSFCRVSF